MFDLRQLLHRYPDVAERHAVLVEMRQLARAGGRPLTGAWYWVPFREGRRHLRWEIEEFFDCWKPNSDHVYIWRHVREWLEFCWGRSLKRADYYSLPRGRVSQILGEPASQSDFALYHGNDSPRGKTGLVFVRQLFNLKRSTSVVFDDHERMVAGQPEALSSLLGFDLGLKGIDSSELDLFD